MRKGRKTSVKEFGEMPRSGLKQSRQMTLQKMNQNPEGSGTAFRRKSSGWEWYSFRSPRKNGGERIRTPNSLLYSFSLLGREKEKD